MSASPTGEGPWTMINVCHETAEQLRRLPHQGDGYDGAIGHLLRREAQRAGVPTAGSELVVHLGAWMFLAACGRCGWYRIRRGRRAGAEIALQEHAATCRP
jgi:hypothetical protein